MASIYDDFKEDLLDGSVDLDNDTFKCALLDNSHSFSASDSTWADISANEISGTGYTAGGATLASLTIAVASNIARWDAADVSWTTATFSAYHAVIYDTSNSDSLVCSIDLGGEQSVVAGTFSIEWSSGGILSLT
jgi:hypothetical protein